MVKALCMYHSGHFEVFEYPDRQHARRNMIQLLPEWSHKHKDRLVSMTFIGD